MAGRDSRDRSWHWSFRCSRAHFCGITCSTWIVAAAMAPPTSDVAQRRPRLEPPPTGAGPRHEPDLRFLVELPGIEPELLSGIMPSDLPVRSLSFRFGPVR